MASLNVEHWYRGRKGANDLAKALPLSAQQMHNILDKVISHANDTLEKRVRHPRSAHTKCWPRWHLKVFEDGDLPRDENLARRYASNIKKHAEKSGVDAGLAVTVPVEDNDPPVDVEGW
jgi:hypothetical protein